MAIFGYVRKDYPVSTMDQFEALKEYELDNLFVEENDYKKIDELDKLLTVLNPNDQVVIYDFKVFGKTMRELADYIEKLAELNIQLISLTHDMKQEDIIAFYKMFLLLHKIDKEINTFQSKTRIEAARKKGVELGRPKIEPEVARQIHFLYTQRNYSYRKIAQECDVSVGTVCKYAHKALEEE